MRFGDPTRSVPTLLVAAVLGCSWASASSVEIRGLFTITEEDARRWIEPQLSYIDSAGVSMAKADDAAYFLENAMRERGYDEASVDWNLVGEGADRRIRLQVSEGTISRIEDFEISGNRALEDAAVIELLTETTRNRLDLGEEDRVPFVPRDLETGIRKLENFYRLLGYNETEFVSDFDSDSNGARVVLRIEEGPAQRVRAVELPEARSEKLQKAFSKVIEEFTGRPLNPPLVANLTSRVRSLAVNAGYYEADVEISENLLHSARPVTPEELGPEPDPAAADSEERPIPGEIEGYVLVASIDWGPAVALSKITVEGNESVEDDFFSRHFESLVGESYSPAETNAAVEDLLQTGAFETIRTDPVRQPDGSFHLEVDIEEAHTRTLAVYAGFEHYEGAIGGFEFTNLNLFGAVRSLDSRIEFSKRGAKGRVTYEDPWLLDTRIRFRGGVFGQTREEEGYDKWQTGGNYEFTRKFGPDGKDSISLFGRASYTEVENSRIRPALIGDPSYFGHEIGVTLTHDRRDSPRIPRKGYLARTSVSVASDALGSEVEYLKATGHLGYYHPVGDHTFRLAARAGAISPLGDTQVIPIDLRFFNGGPQTVRSFQERSLGPIDTASGNPLGGEFYSVLNAEYEIPIESLDGLSLVAFTDAGNVILDAGDAGFGDLRYAVGLGLRYATPIGPIRAEYGYNPDQRPGEPQGTFHFGFGFSY